MKSQSRLPAFAVLAAAAGLAVGTSACDRTHIYSQYGVNVRAAYARQTIDPEAGKRAHSGGEGLDPQEAAIVLDTYRKSLSPKGDSEAARRTPVMVMPAAPMAPTAAP